MLPDQVKYLVVYSYDWSALSNCQYTEVAVEGVTVLRPSGLPASGRCTLRLYGHGRCELNAQLAWSNVPRVRIGETRAFVKLETHNSKIL
jgi:hypothetical protein